MQKGKETGPKVVAIIQARMGSSRLPGKIFKELKGKPMLWHVVNRLRNSRSIDTIVVATTTKSKDDVVIEFCDKYGIDHFRGAELDVLDRYYNAAVRYNADVVVRITSDCPLIDPVVTDKVISGYLNGKDKYHASSTSVRRTYPRGLDTEVVSFPVLKSMWEKADRSDQREHVTIYMYEHPEMFNILSVENDKDISNLRWTVDEEKDLEFVRAVYDELYDGKEIFLMEDILRLLIGKPGLIEINKNVEQKKVMIQKRP